MKTEIINASTRYAFWLFLLLLCVELERLGGLLGLTLWMLLWAQWSGIKMRYLFFSAFVVDAIWLRPLGMTALVLAVILYVRASTLKYNYGGALTWLTTTVGMLFLLKVVDHNWSPVGGCLLVPGLVIVAEGIRQLTRRVST